MSIELVLLGFLVLLVLLFFFLPLLFLLRVLLGLVRPVAQLGSLGGNGYFPMPLLIHRRFVNFLPLCQ